MMAAVVVMTAGIAEMMADVMEDTGMIGTVVPDMAMMTDGSAIGIMTGVSGGRAKIQITTQKT